MSGKKSYVRRIIEFFIGHSSRDAAYSKARPLQLESLEVREMLSGISIYSTQDAVEDGQSGYFVLKREDTSTRKEVQISIDDYDSGRAIIGNDYQIQSDALSYFDYYGGSYYGYGYGYLVFEEGISSVTIYVDAFTDGWIEGDEIVHLNIYDYGDYTSISAELTIHDADIPVNVWVVETVNAEEDGLDGYIKLQRDVISIATTLQFTLDSKNVRNATPEEGKARNEVDFVSITDNYYANSGTVRFAAGEEFAYITISAIDDDFVEGEETLSITFIQPEPYDYYTQATSAVTILGDKTAQISIEDNEEPLNVWVKETGNGKENGYDGFITLERSNNSGTLLVHYEINNGNSDYYYDNQGGWAGIGFDFEPLPGIEYYYDYYSSNRGTVTFQDGEYTVTFPVQVKDDIYIEGDEKIEFKLIVPDIGKPLYQLDKSKPVDAVLTIFDEEEPVNVWISEVQNAAERGQGGFIRFERDNTSRELTVYYQLDGRNNQGGNYKDWAENGRDFNGLQRAEDKGYGYYKVTFAAGENSAVVSINAVDDNYYEGEETVHVS